MELIYNKKFWNNTFVGPEEPSQFALFCRGFMNPGDSVIDLGCGNGRDSIYFRSESLNVTALDCVDRNIKDIKFINHDFESLLKDNSHFHYCKFDFAYCRFLLHAVPKYIEWNILTSFLGKTLMIEVRSDKGILPDQSHYRRLINLDSLIMDLRYIGYKIIYQVEQKDLAIYNNENPVIIRIVCQQ